MPDDEEAANAYNTRRHAGTNADQQLLDDSAAAEEIGEETDEYGFKFVRDYDAIRRETNKEYIFLIEDGEEDAATKQEEEGRAMEDSKPTSSSSTAHRRQKGAYYVPLVGHTLLRKRRARKGEVRNDYDDLGIEFWGGMLVQLGGKEVFPEDEAEARKLELDSIRNPPPVAYEDPAETRETHAQAQEPKTELPVNGDHVQS